MNKIKLTGVKNIPIVEDISTEKEYILILRAIPVGEFISAEAEEPKTYHLKVHSYDSLQPIGEKPLNIKQGISKSQQLRYIIEHELGYDYDIEMEKIINHYRQKNENI